MSEEMEHPKKSDQKKDAEATPAESTTPKSKLQADLKKKQAEAAKEASPAPKSKIQADLEKKQADEAENVLSIEMPRKGVPATVELEQVIHDFQRVSNELQTAAQKAVFQKTGKVAQGVPANKSIVLSLDEQPVSDDLSGIIDLLATEATAQQKERAESVVEELVLESSPREKTNPGKAAKRVVPTSTEEQPISFELAASISKLQNSMGLKSIDAADQPILSEVKIGDTHAPRPTLKLNLEEKAPTPPPPPAPEKGTNNKPLSLQTRPDMERVPPKTVKSGARLAGKEYKRPEARENTELVKGANVKLKRCPKCQAETNMDTVICTECGYNFETGRTHLTPAKKKKIRQGLEITFWALLAVMLLLACFRPKDMINLYKATIGPSVTPLYETYIRPYLTGEHDPELQAWILEQKSKPVNVGAKALSDEEIQTLKAKLEAEINSKFPLLKSGDEALFITTDGTAASARFIGIEGDQIILELNGKRTRGALQKLTPESRLLVDTEYRQAYLAKKLKQALN